MKSGCLELTRENLYDCVWSQPMSKVAPTYGITDVALAKICRKMDIPRPPVGYWQRLAFGAKIPRPPLPPLRPGIPTEVRVEPQRRPSAAQSPEAAARAASEKDEKNRIAVAERLAKPHPFIQATLEALRSAKPNEYGLLTVAGAGRVHVRLSKSLIPRAMRIMDALLKALDNRGFRLVGDAAGGITVAIVAEEKIGFAIEELVDRTEHAATEADVERQKRPWSDKPPRWDFGPSGNLKIQITEAASGTRKTWSDRQRRRLEYALNDVVAGMVITADAKRRDRIERERQAQEWREAEQKRFEEAQRRREEEARIQELLKQADAWARAERVRSFVKAVEQAAAERGVPLAPDSNLGRWVQWAGTHANRFDPIVASFADTATP